MRKRLYQRLRAAMKASNVTQGDLTDWWNVEHPGAYKYPCWMNSFFTGKRSFPMDLAYWILDCLGISRSELATYFPYKGVD